MPDLSSITNLHNGQRNENIVVPTIQINQRHSYNPSRRDAISCQGSLDHDSDSRKDDFEEEDFIDYENNNLFANEDVTQEDDENENLLKTIKDLKVQLDNKNQEIVRLNNYIDKMINRIMNETPHFLRVSSGVVLNSVTESTPLIGKSGHRKIGKRNFKNLTSHDRK